MKQFFNGKLFGYLREVWLPIALLSAFFSLRWLFNDNVGIGTINEANMLPFARQQVEPGWIPQDWYLNQPPGYRVLFVTIIGRMTVAWGFLTTSIVGRLLGYGLLASGLVFLSRRLRLRLPLLLLALVLLLYSGGITSGAGSQGAVAREWLIAGIEPKVPAYSLILYAIGCMLSGQLLWMALLLGLATSFHTLVGGWAVIAAIGWLVLRRRGWILGDWRRLAGMVMIYAAAAGFAMGPIVQQLSHDSPVGRFSASFAYVFLRTPHHLNPLSWAAGWWIKPVLLLLLLAVVVFMLHQQEQQLGKEQSPSDQRRLGLAEFTLVSLWSFGLGLAVAPFDQEGKFLQYYPFRFGDIMLPLNTFLLFACAMQDLFAGKRWRTVLGLVCVGVLVVICGLRWPVFWEDARSLREFPGQQQRVTLAEKALYSWIRQHTSRDALFVTSPIDLTSFSWLTERATIAKYRLVPPTGSGMASWLERLTDLSGPVDPWEQVSRFKDNRDEIRDRLSSGYDQLSTEQAIALMQKYRADYIVTQAKQILALPIVYSNSRYSLYQRQ